ncbi:MAG: porin family protein [Alcanivorax sp.]|nr:porin family protein [Alcanivorax sp.]
MKQGKVRMAMAAAMTISMALAPVALADRPISQGQIYAGALVSQFTLDVDGISDRPRPLGVVGRLGYFLTDQIALEARAGTGFEKDRVSGINTGLDRLYGGYLLGLLPLGESSAFYWVAGYSDARVSLSGGGVSEKDSADGFSYGAGFDFFASDGIGLSAEYIRYLDKDDYDLYAISLGMRYSF